VYEIKTVLRPEKIMAMMMELRDAGGKFLAKFSDDQSSTRSEATSRMGMVRRLL
jgi:hypothetical protein